MSRFSSCLLVWVAVLSIPSVGCCNTLRDRLSQQESATSSTSTPDPPAPRAGDESSPSPTPAGPAKGAHGFSQQTLKVAGAARSVGFYAPASRSGRPPLIIAFHGTSGSTGDWVAGNDDPSGIQGLADEHGFVVAAPQSRFLPQSDWDHEYEGGDKYWETAAPRGTNPNANPDLLLVSALIASAQSTFGVDPKRIYALGFSNGGFFAVLTAMALRDKIAAFAEAGSGLVTCATTRSCTAQSRSTDCAAILRGAGCSCSGAEKPTTIPTNGRLVPGLLGHNNRDDVVSSVYTCALHQRMKSLGYDAEVMIGNAEGHGFPEEFLPRAWAFFAARRLP